MTDQRKAAEQAVRVLTETEDYTDVDELGRLLLHCRYRDLWRKLFHAYATYHGIRFSNPIAA